MEVKRWQEVGSKSRDKNGDEIVPLQAVSEQSEPNDLHEETPEDLKDDEYLPLTKQDIVNTVAIISAYVSFGFSVRVWGPALVDMANLMRTDVKTIVLIFTAQSGGGILGSLIVAFLAGRINHNLILIPCISVVTTCLIISPWLPNVTFLIALIGFSGIFVYSIHTLVQVYAMALWRRSRHKSSLMQGLFFSFSVAATICPVIIDPFLSKKIHHENFPGNNSAAAVEKSQQNESSYYPSFLRHISEMEQNNSFQNVSSNYGQTNVNFGILTIACIIALPVGICIFAFCYEGMQVHITKHADDGQQQRPKHISPLFRIMFMLVSSVMFGLYISIENTIGNLISTFVIIGLSWEKYKGSLITSLYWGSFGLSRLLAVVITRYVKPEKMLTLLMLTIITCLVILSAAVNSHEAVAWVCVSLIGAAEGPLFGCALIFVGSVVKIDGIFSAVLTIAVSIAIMSTSAVVGFLFETFGYMAMVYYLLATSAVLALVFGIVYFLEARIRQMHTGC